MPYADLAELIETLRHHHAKVAHHRKAGAESRMPSDIRWHREELDFHIGHREIAISTLCANIETGILPLYSGQTTEQIDAFLGDAK